MKRYKKWYRLLGLLLAVSTLAAGCAKKAGDVADKLTSALLAAKTVSRLQDENSADMDVEIDFGVKGDFSGLLQNFGFSSEDASLSAETETTLSVQAIRDPVAVQYSGSTAIGLSSDHSLSIPQDGYVVMENETPVSYQKIGPIWYRYVMEDAGGKDTETNGKNETTVTVEEADTEADNEAKGSKTNVEANTGSGTDTQADEAGAVVSANTDKAAADEKTEAAGTDGKSDAEGGAKAADKTEVTGTKDDGEKTDEKTKSAAESDSAASWPDMFIRVFQAVSDDSLQAEIQDDKETVNGQESYVMNISLTGDLLEEVVTAAMHGLSSGRGSGLVDLEGTDWDSITADARFYIAADRYLPVRAEIDIHELMNAALNSALSDSEIMKLLDGVEVSVTDMEIDVDFNSFGTVEEIAVPQDARENAVTAK